MTRKEKYFEDHPFADKIFEFGGGTYPADQHKNCLCAKEVGYADYCEAGEGFFDCRDCWNSKYNITLGE